eukprot:scaffold2247_cov112-Isochrysis_galbana.AAC.1
MFVAERECAADGRRFLPGHSPTGGRSRPQRGMRRIEADNKPIVEGHSIVRGERKGHTMTSITTTRYTHTHTLS